MRRYEKQDGKKKNVPTSISEALSLCICALLHFLIFNATVSFCILFVGLCNIIGSTQSISSSTQHCFEITKKIYKKIRSRDIERESKRIMWVCSHRLWHISMSRPIFIHVHVTLAIGLFLTHTRAHAMDIHGVIEWRGPSLVFICLSRPKLTTLCPWLCVLCVYFFVVFPIPEKAIVIRLNGVIFQVDFFRDNAECRLI